LLTLSLANLLEARGIKGRVKIIDGSPQWLQKLVSKVIPDKSEKTIQFAVISGVAKILMPDEFENTIQKVFAHDTPEIQLETFIKIAESRNKYSADYGKKMLKGLMKRVKMCLEIDSISFGVCYSTSMTLITPTEVTVKDIDEDYGLSRYCSGIVNVTEVEGNHSSILKNSKLIELLNN
jgi:fatty acid synthase, animal type